VAVQPAQKESVLLPILTKEGGRERAAELIIRRRGEAGHLGRDALSLRG